MESHLQELYYVCHPFIIDIFNRFNFQTNQRGTRLMSLLILQILYDPVMLMLSRSSIRVKTLPVHHKIWTRDITLIVFANFFIFLGFQMTLPTLPLFVKELGGSDQLIGVIVGVFTFSALIFRPYAGHSLETKGRRIVYMFG